MGQGEIVEYLGRQSDEMTVPQMIEIISKIRQMMAEDPCLQDLSPVASYLLREMTDRCQLARSIAAEMNSERRYH